MICFWMPRYWIICLSFISSVARHLRGPFYFDISHNSPLKTCSDRNGCWWCAKNSSFKMVRMQSSLAVTERREYRRDGSHVHHGRRRPVTHTVSDWERFSFPVKLSGQGGKAERISMKICMEWSCDGHLWELTLMEKDTMISLGELRHTCVLI